MVASTGFTEFDVPATIVEENIDQMRGRLDTALVTVQGIIGELTSIDFDVIETSPPEFALTDPHVPPVVAPVPPSGAQQFGTIDPWEDPGYEDLSGDAGIDTTLVLAPGGFNPTIGDPQFPEALGALDMSGAPTPPPVKTEFAEPPDPGTFDGSGKPDSPPLNDIDIPDPLGDIDTSGLPSKPPITDFTIPDPPPFVQPPDPVYIDINFPGVLAYNIPDFDGDRPVFDGDKPTDTFSWAEPSYSGPVYADMVAKTKFVLAGNTALTDAIQRAFFSAARDRESTAALGTIQDASDEWAGRGFTVPIGMLNKTVVAAREKALVQSNALSRDILLKVATWTREDVMAALGHAVAIEGMVHGWFEATTERSFQVAKYHLEVEMKLYELAIAKFNSAQSAYQTDAVVFGKKIEAELGKLQVQKASLEQELAKGEINEQRLKKYLGALDGVKTLMSTFASVVAGRTAIADNNRSILQGFATDVQAYHEIMEARKVPYETQALRYKGAELQSSLNRNLVDIFGVETGAWKETLTARKVPFEVYSARLQDRKTSVEAEHLIQENFSLGIKNWGELLNARMSAFQAHKLNAEVEGLRVQARRDQLQGFVEELRGASIEKDNKAQFVQLKIAAMRASTEKYSARLTAERERVQSELSDIEARTKTFIADVSRYTAEIQGQTEAQRTSFQFTQSEERIRLEFYALRLKEYDAALARLQNRQGQLLEGIKAAGQYATALAAGFASGIHVQAGISGGGSVTVSDSYTHEVRP